MRRSHQSGQALVFVGLSLVVLTAIVGLAIDMGYLRYTKRRLPERGRQRRDRGCLRAQEWKLFHSRIKRLGVQWV